MKRTESLRGEACHDTSQHIALPAVSHEWAAGGVIEDRGTIGDKRTCALEQKRAGVAQKKLSRRFGARELSRLREENPHFSGMWGQDGLTRPWQMTCSEQT